LLAGVIPVQAPVGQAPLQPQQVGGRLGHIHVDGVQLLDGRQSHRLIGGHDGAFGDTGSADAPGNGRGDACIRQVDAGRLHRGLSVKDIGLGLPEGGGGIVVVLLADRLFGQQFLVAVDPGLSGRQIGPGSGKGGLRVFQRCLKRGGINPIKDLARLYIGALGKQPFLDQAVDLGSDFGDPIGRCPSGQFGGQRDRLALDGHHRYLWRRCRRSGFLGRLLTADHYQNGERQNRQTIFDRQLICRLHGRLFPFCIVFHIDIIINTIIMSG
jgi:hypothetical protein